MDDTSCSFCVRLFYNVYLNNVGDNNGVQT